MRARHAHNVRNTESKEYEKSGETAGLRLDAQETLTSMGNSITTSSKVDRVTVIPSLYCVEHPKPAMRAYLSSLYYQGNTCNSFYAMPGPPLQLKPNPLLKGFFSHMFLRCGVYSNSCFTFYLLHLYINLFFIVIE